MIFWMVATLLLACFAWQIGDSTRRIKKLERQQLQREAFEIRTMAIDYRRDHKQWPVRFEQLVKDTEYKRSESLHGAPWGIVCSSDGSGSNWTISVIHHKGFRRDFCIDMP